MELKLPQIYPIKNPEDYKLHLACWNGSDQPLDVFVRDRNEWDNWNKWRAKRDDFSRDFIFALINNYHEENSWLFGGVYQVISRKPVDDSPSYNIKLLNECKPYIGRLKVTLKRPGRAKAVNFEKYYKDITVSEVLSVPYTGEAFPGYDKIDVSFLALEQIIRRQRSDWKAALGNAKGVYLISDIHNGKRYVGAAYGSSGIWSRWTCYIDTGHGYNDDLTHLIKKQGLIYVQKYFRFALLDYFPMKADDDFIIHREAYWKEVLQTRGERGYNKN